MTRGSRVGGLLAVIVLITGVASEARADTTQECTALFPTPVAAHDPQARLSFWGGYVAGGTDTLVARSKLDLSLLPLSCGNTACAITGSAAAQAILPPFPSTQSSARLNVGWLGNEFYQGSSRDFRDVSIGLWGTLRLPASEQPWRIRNLSIGLDGTLILGPGDYWVENLSLALGAELKVQGEGTVRLHVRNTFSVPLSMHLNAGGETTQLLVVAYDNLSLQTSAGVTGSVYAVGDVSLATGASITGDLAASTANLQLGARVTAISDSQRGQLDYGDLCHNTLDPDLEVPDEEAPVITLDQPDGQRQEAAVAILSGHVTDTGGPSAGVAGLWVTRSDTGDAMQAAISGTAFSTSLPVAFGDNHFSVLARDHSGNETTLGWHVIREDVTAPQVSLSGPPQETVQRSPFMLEGEVDDGEHGSGVSTIVVTRAGQSETTPVTRDGNQFSVAVPVQWGDNILQVTVTDIAGNSTVAEKQVTRTDQIPPDLVIHNPPSAIVGAATVTVTGVAQDDTYGSGVARIVVDNTSVPGTVITVTPGANGEFSASIALGAGLNQISITAEDQFANRSVAAISVTRPDQDGDGIPDDIDPDRDGDGYSNEEEISRGTDPDDPNDYPDDVAPVLTVNNPPEARVTRADIQVTGTAVDDRAMHSVTLLNHRFGIPLATTLQAGGHYSGLVPLEVGDNAITVTARDAAGNESSEVIQVLRVEPPRLVNVSPAQGVMVHDPVVTLSGEIHGVQTAEMLTLQVNGAQVMIGDGQGDAQTGFVYPFAVTDLPLDFGVNRFVLQLNSPDGHDSRTLDITRLPEDEDSVPPPTLTLLTPLDGAWQGADTVQVRGRIEGGAGAVEITVNGVRASRVGGAAAGTFSSSLTFTDGAGTLTVSVTATDQLGRAATQSVTVYRDTGAPVIALDNPLAPLPADNPVNETPYRLAGTVTDPRLAGMLIDGAPVMLVATAAEGEYRFAADVPLSAGTRTVSLEAHDLAGNRVRQSYQFTLSPSALLMPILPMANTRFVVVDNATTSVVARLAGQAAGATAVALLDGETFPLTLGGTLVQGSVQLPTEEGPHSLRIEINHPDAGLVAAANIPINIANPSQQPLTLVRSSPASDAGVIAPNQTLTFHFNRPVDPATLNVSIKETLHGLTYINQDASGTDFLRAQGYKLQTVHRALEPVPGTVDILPGARAVTFVADRYYGYGATLDAEIIADGISLGRARFTVEPLPTQVSGNVADQFGNPVAGVTVALGPLRTTTDAKGGYQLGFGEQSGHVAGGVAELVFNPAMQDPRFGTRRQPVTVRPGEHNRLGLRTVLLLNENTGFSGLRSGATTRLANDQLEIDLTQAVLHGPEGAGSVTVNPQFLPLERLGLETTGPVPLFGVYVLQPDSLRVEGQVGLSMAVPMYQGTREWMQDGSLVMVLGLNDNRSALAPVGVAEVVGERVILRRAFRGRWLDYLGIAPVTEQALPALQAWVAGEGGWATVQTALGAGGR